MTSFGKSLPAKEEQWIYVSDMMAGLMMIFLFISIMYIKDISDRYGAYESKKEEICDKLRGEFIDSVREGNMSICEKGVHIKFDDNLYYDTDSWEPKPDFKDVLRDFFPRLMDIVILHEDSISELRIEGHTDSTGPHREPLKDYLYNTDLSQRRSKRILEYSIEQIKYDKRKLEWAFSKLTAHGLSSSKKIMVNGVEDTNASRRVEFRLRLSEEDNLMALIKSDLAATGGTF